MTRPADITAWDELRSLQGYLAQEFTSDEIRLERPQEDEPYDMLIEPPLEIMSEARGTYMADRTIPLTVQRWCTTYLDALDVMERIERVFHTGHGLGDKRRVPVWKYPLPGAPSPSMPDTAATAPDRFLRVEDVSVRILPSEKLGEYIVICDLRLKGWRIIHQHTDQTIDVVNATTDVVP